jgi:methylmalonyl-CoA/ethylmalonyl-CoA epimerase
MLERMSPREVDYEITQISVVVRDVERTMETYTKVLGWGPWNVHELRPPIHHSTELRGKPVHYALLGAEVHVGPGGMNFELLQPLEGESIFHEFLEQKGEGIASMACMFKTREESEKVKAQFRSMGHEIILRGCIGDHIEYYYFDTEPLFKLHLEFGSGHAIDFIEPTRRYGE